MQIQYIDRKSGEIRIEKPPGQKLLRLLYSNSLGNKTILPLARKKMISIYYGKQMDKASSVHKIPAFVQGLNIDLDEAEKSIDEFTSFNDFFYRKLKKEARMIHNGLVSPGDGRLLAFEKVEEVNNFYVKGRKFTLSEFLQNPALAQTFKNHHLIILRLAPNDYHRFHFPYDGTPSPITPIKGAYYSVSPIALVQNFSKVFCENKREYCILKTQKQGDILMAPVGATLVGSIITTYTAHQKIIKGQEMGYFAFGGSTIVLLVDSTRFKIDQDLIENTQNHLETYVQMGESIAQEI